MASAGGDEVAAFLGNDAGDRLRILTPQRLAGQDNHAGIDLLGRQRRRDIRIVNDRAKSGVVDPFLVLIRCQRHRRLKQRLARDDVIAAGQILGQAAQMYPREDDLRARRADIDSDGGQRNIVLLPQRIVFECAVLVEIVVVIMIGIVGVRMRRLPAVEMIGQGVWRLGFFLFGHRVASCGGLHPPHRIVRQ